MNLSGGIIIDIWVNNKYSHRRLVIFSGAGESFFSAVENNLGKNNRGVRRVLKRLTEMQQNRRFGDSEGSYLSN